MKSGSRISRLRSETCYTVIRLSDIIGKVLSYHPNPRIELIEKAYVFSAQVHKGQLRLSGEPYLIHPLEVAALLADLKLDDVSVTTGILHDTVEDTFTTPETIEEAFGPEVASLVDGVTKISKMSFRATEEKQADNFRKMLLAMSKDIRVILIKLADRLHNMRTLHFLPPEKTVELAQETMDIYAPLANRLGIFWMKSELEDLSLLYLRPEVYHALEELRLRGVVTVLLPGVGARIKRYRHEAGTYFHWGRSQQAVMAELLLRGPQTVGELRGRCSRMTPFETLEAVTAVLDALVGCDPPRVAALSREPGRSAIRHAQRLYAEPDHPAVTVSAAAAPTAPAPATRNAQTEIEELRSRLAEVQEQVADLRRRLASIESQLL